MPLPLYGSGGRTLRISAATWPTCCLSIPLTTISVGVGTSYVIPAGASLTTGCENPTFSSSAVPRRDARYPTPWISSFFSKPFVTPSTMFAMSVRVRPCSARSSPRSVGRVTVTVPSSCAICMRCGTCCCSEPSGPDTATRPGSTWTVTPAGTSIGLFPIRLMRLPDETDDFAADPALLRGAARDETGRRREDRDAHPAEHARQAVLARVDPPARLGDALQAADDPLAIPAELEVDDQGIERFALLHVIVADVALFLQQARDLDLHLRGRHPYLVVQRLVGVADAGEHVCDRIGQHRYQLDLVMPGIAPWCASSRRQMRHRPNFLNTARGRPQRLQRV